MAATALIAAVALWFAGYPMLAAIATAGSLFGSWKGFRKTSDYRTEVGRLSRQHEQEAGQEAEALRRVAEAEGALARIREAASAAQNKAREALSLFEGFTLRQGGFFPFLCLTPARKAIASACENPN